MRIVLDTDVEVHEGNQRDNIDTSLFMTTKDHEDYREGRQLSQYNASILYADEDVEFAAGLIHRLEKEAHLTVFVPERDLLIGVIEHSATMKMIASRCGKLILVLSPSFLKSSINKYLLKYAESISIGE